MRTVKPENVTHRLFVFHSPAILFPDKHKPVEKPKRRRTVDSSSEESSSEEEEESEEESSEDDEPPPPPKRCVLGVRCRGVTICHGTIYCNAKML